MEAVPFVHTYVSNLDFDLLCAGIPMLWKDICLDLGPVDLFILL